MVQRLENEGFYGQFNRRRAIEIPGRGTLYLVSPEDLILNKLRWEQQTEAGL